MNDGMGATWRTHVLFCIVKQKITYCFNAHDRRAKWSNI